jgi:hypothetical protein
LRPANIGTFDVGQIYVQQDDVIFFFAQFLKGFVAAGGIVDLVSFGNQRCSQRAANLRLVIHDQDPAPGRARSH